MSEWRDRDDLKCLGRSHEFTADHRGRGAKEKVAELIYVCMTCPALLECYEDAKKKPRARGVIQGGKKWP